MNGSLAQSPAVTAPKEPASANEAEGGLDIDLDLLCGHKWVHSREEQTSAEQQVYRREDFNFPPSRWRMEFIFEKDGKCQWYYLSPDDGHSFKPGQWSAVAGQKKTIKIQGNNEVVYQVTELSDPVLRMTKLDNNDIQERGRLNVRVF